MVQAFGKISQKAQFLKIKLLFSLALWLEFSGFSLKVPQNSTFRHHFGLFFLKFWKKTSNFTSFMHLGEVSGEISLKPTQVSLIIHHDTEKLRYYCVCMSVFKGRKFETIVFAACFDSFQLKTLAKADIIHDFTKNSSISLFILEICSSKFQNCDTFSLFTQFSHFSYTISYCFSTSLAYLTPVLTVSK